MEDKFMGINIIYDSNLNYEGIQFYKKLIVEVFNEMNFQPEIDGFMLVSQIELCSEKDERFDNYEAVFFHRTHKIIIHININEEDEEINFKELLFHEITHAIFEFDMFYKEYRALEYIEDSFELQLVNEYRAYYKTYKKFIKLYNKIYIKRLKENFYSIYKDFNRFEFIDNDNNCMHHFINSLASRLALGVILKEPDNYDVLVDICIESFEEDMIQLLKNIQHIQTRDELSKIKNCLEMLIKNYKKEIWDTFTD